MSHADLHIGDVFEVMSTLPDDSVDLVLTSPPFLALRSYLPEGHPDKDKEIGSEPTPAAFIDTMLALTTEWERLLAPHGSIAIELGDTYSGSSQSGGDRSAEQNGEWTKHRRGAADPNEPDRKGDGWPDAKSACLIPELYRTALAYGINPLTGQQSPAGRWRVRNTVRWVRPNPPVGALGDKYRPATSEMVIACKAKDRWFDLDAVRTPAQVQMGREVDGNNVKGSDGGSFRFDKRVDSHPAGAPPLDWWNIPTHPYVTPDGLIVVPSGETVRHVRVPLDAPGDDIQRTTSPDCPLHGSPDHPDSNAPDDERADSESSRTAHIDNRHAQEPEDGSLPTPAPTAQTDLFESPRARSANPRSKMWNKTGHAPETNLAGTPFVQNADGIDDTPTSPESSEKHHDKPENSTSAASLDGSEHETESRIAHSSDQSSACTCSYWIELDVSSEVTSDYAGYPGDSWEIPTFGFKGAHYATWPPELCRIPIESMCPRQVCTTCGEPRRRMIETTRPIEPDDSQRIKNANGERPAPGRQDRPPEVGWEVNRETIGWSVCDCPTPTYRPGLVLDPFAGSGTTLAVATGHSRDAIGIDLDQRNADLAHERVGMFLTVHDSH